MGAAAANVIKRIDERCRGATRRAQRQLDADGGEVEDEDAPQCMHGLLGRWVAGRGRWLEKW